MNKKQRNTNRDKIFILGYVAKKFSYTCCVVFEWTALMIVSVKQLTKTSEQLSLHVLSLSLSLFLFLVTLIESRSTTVTTYLVSWRYDQRHHAGRQPSTRTTNVPSSCF